MVVNYISDTIQYMSALHIQYTSFLAIFKVTQKYTEKVIHTPFCAT